MAITRGERKGVGKALNMAPFWGKGGASLVFKNASYYSIHVSINLIRHTEKKQGSKGQNILMQNSD